MRQSTVNRTSTPSRRRAPRAHRLVLVTGLALLMAACEWVPVPTFDQTTPPALSFHHLTRDGVDTFASAARPGRLDLWAPPDNQGTNTRMLVYPGSQPVTDNHQACATWESQDGYNAQQGLALRIRHDLPEGRWRALTVTKNVMWGANWQFNVLSWDSRQPGSWQMWGSVNLAGVFWPGQQLTPLPWRVCARVEGDLVKVKGWPAGAAEPGWDDAVHTGAVRVPAEWVYPGKAGWYVGHLGPGQRTTMTDLELARLELR